MLRFFATLTTVMLTVSASGDKICFHKPKNPEQSNFYLDNCFNYGKHCAENGDASVPDAFCIQKNFDKASSFDVVSYKDRKTIQPTKVIKNGKECHEDYCRGFLQICCTEVKCFSKPKHPSDNSSYLDNCLTYGEDCAETGVHDVPNAYCEHMGYRQSVSFEVIAKDQTANFQPTKTIMSDTECTGNHCRGFKYICCEQ